ncbi:MAG: hypothetical protein EPN93_10150 [Spirochaetes bacterium]|nr:MAG: hypothetical protein EPN93_10150 [Spirochaetota bacterium]
MALHVDQDICMGEHCPANRRCVRAWRCPGLKWDEESGKAKIDMATCVKCNVCAVVCPMRAIRPEKPELSKR